MNKTSTLSTSLTQMFKIRYPIIGAPMFLVSNADMVVEISEAGGLGTLPSLNYRPSEEFKKTIHEIKQRTQKPIGVNLIVNKSNSRQHTDLKISLDAGVELLITSLGNPKEVIRDAHKSNTKVLCDVTNLEHALKVQDLGADGVIAVGSGAGGHAGPISPFALLPWLKKELDIPVVAAGGIANGQTLASALLLGADGVSVGTRFIASTEAQVNPEYKNAIVNSQPDDIVMSTQISGTPASVINTPYIQKAGTELHWALEILKKHPLTKKYIVPLIHLMGMKALEKSATKKTWKHVWSAGQSVGLIHEIKPCKDIIAQLISEYEDTLNTAPTVEPPGASL